MCSKWNRRFKYTFLIWLITGKNKEDYIWNPATCSCENGKYLVSITDDDSVITCDEIIEETKIIPTNFNENK